MRFDDTNMSARRLIQDLEGIESLDSVTEFLGELTTEEKDLLAALDQADPPDPIPDPFASDLVRHLMTRTLDKIRARDSDRPAITGKSAVGLTLLALLSEVQINSFLSGVTSPDLAKTTNKIAERVAGWVVEEVG